MQLRDIRIRDPFIMPVAAKKTYYMYGSTHLDPQGPMGFDAYRSKDLVEWEGPIPIFRPPTDFWSDRDFWAPEVHAWQGHYFLFASFKNATACRGTQILIADSPEGPFRVHSIGPVTPSDWECLDGTLFVDDQQEPWIVFCHEWLQVDDGEICARKLSPSLEKPVSDPKLLFRASEPNWVVSIEKGKSRFVTDGPFLHRLSTGELIMIWSSFSKTGYVLAQAKSKSGTILGPWEHADKPIFSNDGGHGMIFRSFEGTLLVSIHAPNKPVDERAKFLLVRENAGWLEAI
jgi:beta-xylosidase